MGAGLPRVILREIDLSQYVDTLIKGVSCVEGITEKGPIGKPQLISSEAQTADRPRAFILSSRRAALLLVFDVDVSRRGRYHLRTDLLRWHVIEHVIAICDYRVHERLDVRSSCTGVCMVKAFIYSIARKIFELAD